MAAEAAAAAVELDEVRSGWPGRGVVWFEYITLAASVASGEAG